MAGKGAYLFVRYRQHLCSFSVFPVTHLSAVIVLFYGWIKKIEDRSSLITISVIFLIMTLFTGVIDFFILFVFGGLFALFLGMCLVRYLEKRGIFSFIIPYGVALLLPLAPTIIFSYLFKMVYVPLPEVIVDVLTMNLYMLKFILTAFLVGLIAAKIKKDYLFGYTIAFEIVLAAYWIHEILNFQMFG